MRVSNIIENNNEIKFTLNGVDKSIANAIRRVILSDIDCIGMLTTPKEKCDVDVIHNTCRFNNEIIKQRLSCIPVHITDMDTPIDQLQIELDVKNDTSDFKDVTTEDIKIKNTSTGSYLSKDEVLNIFPPNSQTGYYILISRLRPSVSTETTGERLAFTSKLSKVNASVNSMFNVVSNCSYGNTINTEEVNKQLKLKEQELKDGGMNRDNIAFELENWKILDAQRIYLDDSFDFIIKSIGVFSCKDIFHKACDKLINKMQSLYNLFDTDSIKIINTSSTIKNGFDAILQNEDYTLGMILQYLMHVNYYEGANTMTFCGCKKLHPHDSYIMLRVGYSDEETEKDTLINNAKEVLQKGMQIFTELKTML
jgi:DNA-directed RNA polymerase subunit L